MSKFRLALAQLLVEGGEAERNFQRAEKLIQQAVAEKADMVLLPETIDFAWTHPRSINEALPIPGAYSDMFCNWAKQYQIHIDQKLLASSTSMHSIPPNFLWNQWI